MEIDLWQPLAGLGLFLFAMKTIEAALEEVSGQAFRHFIRANTNRPIRGVVSGTLATAVLQSSSLVGLMTLALVGAGVIRLRNALGVIFGANLGTTATGWLVATLGFKLNLDAAALPLIGLGGTLAIAVTSKRLKAYAHLVFGIGLLLLGLAFMKSAVDGIDSFVDPARLAGFSAVEYLLFGVVFSAIVQSSSATMMITLTALHGGIIDLPAAAAVAIGADLGTTVTLLIGAYRGNPGKKRVAAGHLIFNLVTDGMAFALRIPLLGLVSLFGMSDLLSLTAFHSLFNVLGIVLFVPFISRFAGWLERRFTAGDDRISRHLSADTLAVPETAVEAANIETGHLLGRVLQQNLRAFQPPLDAPAIGIRLLVGAEPVATPGQLSEAYERSKRLEGEILAFTTDLQLTSLDPEQRFEVDRCQRVVRDAVHASKCLQDIQVDLRRFHHDPAGKLGRYASAFREAAASFYHALFALRRRANQAVTAGDLAGLATLNDTLHESVHQSLYADVRADLIGAQDISALLNVNRELYLSNQSIIQALAGFLLDQAEAAAYEQQPLANGAFPRSSLPATPASVGTPASPGSNSPR